MSIHLSRIGIRNFRNFKHVDLPLQPSTVIVGENKVGKTNFLHALRLVLDPNLPDSARQLKAEDFWDGLSSAFAGNMIEIIVELSGFEKDTGAKAVLTDCVVGTKPLVARPRPIRQVPQMRNQSRCPASSFIFRSGLTLRGSLRNIPNVT